MEKKEQLKGIVQAIAATVISIFIYHCTLHGLSGLNLNDFVASFLGEAVFALLAFLSVILLKKQEIFRCDMELLKKNWTCAGFFVVYIILILGFALLLRIEITITPGEFLLFLGHLFLVGFAEETFFRGLIQNAFHRYFGEDTKAHVIMAIVCTGTVFGLAHFINADRGIRLLAVSTQALVNVFTGMYLCSIYFRTGKNLWFLIFLHALYDGVVMAANGRLSGATVYDIIGTSGSIGAGGFLFLFAVYFTVLAVILRNKKLEPLLKKEKEQA
jgi:membrane protease YdiL (CAAX protease family)